MQTNAMRQSLAWILAFLCMLTGAATAFAQTPKKPNIVVIWGDDIGYWNVSAYNRAPGSRRWFSDVEAFDVRRGPLAGRPLDGGVMRWHR
jgi:hypothetical protein